MDSHLSKQYEKSDKSLVFIQRLLLIAFIVLTVASIVAGMVFWAKSTTKYTEYRYLYSVEKTYTDWTMVGLGFAFALGGPLFFFTAYKLASVVLWVLFDIKVIRTAVTGNRFTESLLSFDDLSLSNRAEATIAEKTNSGQNSESEVKAAEEIGDCELCDAKNVPVVNAKIVNKMGTFYRRICADCIKNNNATIVK